MPIFATLRSLVFMGLITGGLVTAGWTGLRHMPWAHDHDRGDVVWIGADAR